MTTPADPSRVLPEVSGDADLPSTANPPKRCAEVSGDADLHVHPPTARVREVSGDADHPCTHRRRPVRGAAQEVSRDADPATHLLS